MSSRALVPYSAIPHLALLKNYAILLSRQAASVSKRYTAMFDRAEALLMAACEAHEDLMQKLHDLKQDLHLQTKGVPATEAVDVQGRNNLAAVHQTHEATAAQKEIIKKAFREAVKYAHPAKGGSEEELAMVIAAYKAYNLTALTDYVLAKNRTVLESIAFFKDEAQRHPLAWKMFQASSQYQVVRNTEMGFKDRAEMLARLYLESQIRELELELLSQFQRSIFPTERSHHGHPQEDSEEGSPFPESTSEEGDGHQAGTEAHPL